MRKIRKERERERERKFWENKPKISENSETY